MAATMFWECRSLTGCSPGSGRRPCELFYGQWSLPARDGRAVSAVCVPGTPNAVFMNAGDGLDFTPVEQVGQRQGPTSFCQAHAPLSSQVPAMPGAWNCNFAKASYAARDI